MIERCQNLRFTLEASHPFLIASECRKDQLERDFTTQPGIGGAINFAHSTRAQARGDLEVRELRSDQKASAAI
jgi:hypothetical protein